MSELSIQDFGNLSFDDFDFEEFAAEEERRKALADLTKLALDGRTPTFEEVHFANLHYGKFGEAVLNGVLFEIGGHLASGHIHFSDPNNPSTGFQFARTASGLWTSHKLPSYIVFLLTWYGALRECTRSLA